MRPAQGRPYERISPCPPVAPVVPAQAPGALRLPITPVEHLAERTSVG